jgi:hypothetical protein
MILGKDAAICRYCVAVAHKMLDGTGLMPDVDQLVQQRDGTIIKVK